MKVTKCCEYETEREEFTIGGSLSPPQPQPQPQEFTFGDSLCFSQFPTSTVPVTNSSPFQTWLDVIFGQFEAHGCDCYQAVWKDEES